MPSSAALCPIASRIGLDSDYKQIVLVGLTVGDPGNRPEVATQRSDRKLFISRPNLLCYNSGSVTTYVDCACEFEGWSISAMQTHEQLHRDTKLRSAREGRFLQRFSFGPGGPTVITVVLLLLETMVLGDSWPLEQL